MSVKICINLKIYFAVPKIRELILCSPEHQKEFGSSDFLAINIVTADQIRTVTSNSQDIIIRIPTLYINNCISTIKSQSQSKS